MPAARDFPPRLMPAPAAAHYLGVSIVIFMPLGLPCKEIKGRRLYDRVDLDWVDDNDIQKARSVSEIDSLFGITQNLPDISKYENRELLCREPISASVRRFVMERDGETCRYCGGVNGPWHLDHVMPASRGGPSIADNLVVSCLPCNLSKGAKTPEEWGY